MTGTLTGKWAQGCSVRSSSSLVQFSTQGQLLGAETKFNSKVNGEAVAQHVLVSVAECGAASKATCM